MEFRQLRAVLVAVACLVASGPSAQAHEPGPAAGAAPSHQGENLIEGLINQLESMESELAGKVAILQGLSQELNMALRKAVRIDRELVNASKEYEMYAEHYAINREGAVSAAAMSLPYKTEERSITYNVDEEVPNPEYEKYVNDVHRGINRGAPPLTIKKTRTETRQELVRVPDRGKAASIVDGEYQKRENAYLDYSAQARQEIDLLKYTISKQTSEIRKADIERSRLLQILSIKFSKVGNCTKSIAYAHVALRLRQDLLGDGHAATASSKLWLALMCRATGNDLEAKRLLLEISKDVFKGDPYLENVIRLELLRLDGRTTQDKMPEDLLTWITRGVERIWSEGRDKIEMPDTDFKEVEILKYVEHCSALEYVGELDRAEACYRRCLGLIGRHLGEGHPDAAIVLSRLAGLRERRGSWAEAAGLQDRANRTVLRYIRRALPALDDTDQLAFLNSGYRETFHASLSLGLARRQDPAMASLSAGWVLNGKARAQEALAELVLVARGEGNSEERETVARLREVRKELARLSCEVVRPGDVTNHRRKLGQLIELESALVKRLGRAVGRSALDDPWVELEKVRRAIPRDAVLIEIARFDVRNFQGLSVGKEWLPPRYAAWVIPASGRGEVRIVDLGPADAIEDAVEIARKAVQPPDKKAFQKVLDDVGEQVAEGAVHRALEPLARRILWPLLPIIGPERRWIISPDADLWLAPWAALPLPDGRYAVEGHSISFVLTGRDLVDSRSVGPANPPVIMADPDFDFDLSTRRVLPTALASARGPRLDPSRSGAVGPASRLRGTEVEAKRSAPNVRIYTGAEPRVFLREKALESVFESFPSPAVVILSTHNWRATGHLPANPLLQVGLLLAGCNKGVRSPGPGSEDGVLTGLEIVGCDLRGTDLVVLSACETGLGQVRAGEGVAGLRQAFQLAGARSVVATLWRIPDTESAWLMADFFAGLAKGRDKAEALRSAQLTQIQQRRKQFGAAHPYFWAAYTLTGQVR